MWLNNNDSVIVCSLELEQAQYEVRLASRRYEAVDPDYRLVDAELEARSNAALQSAREVEERLRQNELPANAARIPDREMLTGLAHDLPPSGTLRLPICA